MIVVDTNVLAYAFLPSQLTPAAQAWFAHDSVCATSSLWRSEMLSILSKHLRAGLISPSDAQRIFDKAFKRVTQRVHEASVSHVMELLGQSNCTSYDCEFIAVAQTLGQRLITADRKLRKAFPQWTADVADAPS